jgi:glucose-1-phosphate adenylyltransferase
MITTNELAKDTVAVVLAGGKGTRLGALTRHVCKPALPFGAAYRNIDFSLSNCVNSGIGRIGVATQHKPELLLRHIDEVWSSVVAGPGKFISAWTAAESAPVYGYRGTADAVFRNLATIERLGSRFVLVLAGDHVYKMDYRPMLAQHRERRADVTVGCVEVDAAEASQFGILSVDRHGRIDRFVEKPQTLDQLPGGDPVLASMGIYVFDTDFLSDVLRRDAFSSESRHDFGGDILPSLIRDARVFAYPFGDCDGNRPAYWRDVGTPAAYWRAHLELLDSSPSLLLDDAQWPLPAARGVPKLTARPGRDGSDERSLVADDCVVGGTVRRSVLFSGVKVSQGALVENAVILPGAVIGRDCRLRGVIVDSECRVPDGTVIDHAWRGRASYEAAEPVVVTAEDFSSELVSSCA